MTRSDSWRGPATRVRGRALTLAIFALAIAGGLIGLLIGRWANHQPETPEALAPALGSTQFRRLETPRTLTDFALVDGNAEPFGRARLMGKWSLIFFGFTNCPDVCPMTLATLGQARRQLPDDIDVQLVFITVDPQRDDATTVREYSARFHPDIIGVTGPELQIKAIAMQLGVQYTEPPSAGPHAGHYQIDHTTSLALVDSKARLFGMVPVAGSANSLATSLREIFNES